MIYKIARLKLKDNRWRPPDRTEQVLFIVADRMTQQGGMIDFWDDDDKDNPQLIASFHAQWWTAAARVYNLRELEEIINELKKSGDDYYPTL